MRRIENISEKLVILALRQGLFSRKRMPSPLKVLSLDLALSKVPISKLAKELAYCLCTDAKDRLHNDRYHIAFNAIPLKDWSCIAVITKGRYIKTFDDLTSGDEPVEESEETPSLPIISNVN